MLYTPQIGHAPFVRKKRPRGPRKDGEGGRQLPEPLAQLRAVLLRGGSGRKGSRSRGWAKGCPARLAGSEGCGLGTSYLNYKVPHMQIVLDNDPRI